MSRTYVAGAPRTRADRVAAAKRALHRRKRAGEAAFARFVSKRTDEQLEGAPVGPVFLALTPYVLRAHFQPECSIDHDGRDIDALILLDITRDGGERRDQLEIVLKDQKCRIRRHDGSRKPDGTLTTSLADMIRMATAAAETSVLISEGRVVVSGDAFLVYRFPAMFKQPTRPAIVK